MQMHEMGSNAARITMKDGKTVSQMYKKGARKHNLSTFWQLMELFNQKPEQNVIPILRDVKEVCMERLAKANFKSTIAIEANMTVMEKAEGAVANSYDDDEKEVMSGLIEKSNVSAKVR